MSGETPSQTVGPFFAVELPFSEGPYVVADGTEGAIWLRGRVLDGAGDPVPDAMVETWQADPRGAFGPEFRGFGRSGTDDDGGWAILTVKPGRVEGADGGTQAPHVAVSVFARGLLRNLTTRLYFGDEARDNATDPVLSSLPDDRRTTLIAVPEEGGYRFDIHLQGPHETVFFDV